MRIKILSIFTMIFAISFIAGCGKDAPKDKSLNQIKAKGYFVLGLDDEFPPMGFRGEKNDEITGFDIDLAKEAAKRMGVELKIKPVAWDGIILSLNKGDIDVVWNGMTITEERQKKIAFTKPYLNNQQIIMVQKDSKIQNIDDIKGKIVGLQLGSSSENALNRQKDLVKNLKEVKKYENNTLALMDLAAGRSDAVVVDEIVGRYNMAKKPNTFKVLKDSLGKELYGVGVRKNDITFKEALDRVLDEIKKDEVGEQISRKWFGENILLK